MQAADEASGVRMLVRWLRESSNQSNASGKVMPEYPVLVFVHPTPVLQAIGWELLQLWL
jgi:hypothetical protein